MDGHLAEVVWSDAAKTGAFVNAGTGRPVSAPQVGGEARLFWNDAGLYVAIEIADADVRGGFPPDAVDPHLWERDTAEIMLDPDGDGDNEAYFEIQVNPQGLVFDSRFDAYNAPRGGPDGPFGHEDWKSEVEVGVRVLGTLDDASDRDEGYVVELRLPWSSLVGVRRSPPAAGDEWRVNFYAMQDNGGSAWSPILGRGNFHRASRFGRIRF